MRYVVDLHSHSGYAGGVGSISLPDVAGTMRAKGIHAFGTGDCLQPAWLESLQKTLIEKEQGLFSLAGEDNRLSGARFILQTEIIITSPVESGGRKGTHVVLVFPSFSAVHEAVKILRCRDVKLDMGRPFVKCQDNADVAALCSSLREIDESILIIPAHVMTPQGVYGSDHPVNSLYDVFGEFAEQIRIVETGLSADPKLLSLLPELDNRTLISNSDCHSAALNRVGREFTALDVNHVSYSEIASSLRSGKVMYTAEFNPTEGRFFLSGHRAGLENHGESYCFFSPDRTPGDQKCPICGKPLTIGVLERALELSAVQCGGKGRRIGERSPKQEGRRLVPLVEVIAAGLGVKSVTSPKVLMHFRTIINKVGTECTLWEIPESDIADEFSGSVPSNILEALLKVRKGDFSFSPPGYDGTYGKLALGEKERLFGWAEIVMKDAGHNK